MLALKSLFSSDTTQKDIKFFAGNYVTCALDNSLFGRTRKCISDVFGADIAESNKLPNIVVIGMENVGKSSLIERLTKCRIFPKDHKFCTRCPVKLQLHNAIRNMYRVTYRDQVINVTDCTKIYEIVNNYMCDNIAICDDEIIVDIYGPSLQEFEFYDLPGIVSHPPENEAKIIEIYKRYMTREHTIIVCAVPATTTSIHNCKCICLVKNLKLEHNCIIALTMMDKVSSSDISDIILNMLVDIHKYNIDADTCRSCIEGFSSCVAITNKFDIDENLWFKKEILDTLNDDTLVSDVSKKVGVDNLMIHINKLYGDYIRNVWKPTIAKKMTDDRMTSVNILASIGTDPTLLTDDEKKNIIEYITVISLSDNKIEYVQADGLKEVYGNSKRYEDVNKYIRNVKITDLAEYNKIMLNIETCFNKDLPFVLVRFSALKYRIIDRVNEVLTKLWNRYSKRLRCSLNTILDQYLIDDVYINAADFVIKSNKLAKSLIFDRFCNSQSLGPYSDFAAFFNEDEKYIHIRHDAQVKIYNIEKYIGMLDNLHV